MNDELYIKDKYEKAVQLDNLSLWQSAARAVPSAQLRLSEWQREPDYALRSNQGQLDIFSIVQFYLDQK
jgi:hypothetical protein